MVPKLQGLLLVVNPCPKIPLLEVAHEPQYGTFCGKGKEDGEATHKTPRWRDAVSDGPPKLVSTHHQSRGLLAVLCPQMHMHKYERITPM
jgi:hypothetical protein